MNTFGKNLRISLFGESHGQAIGITIDHYPANRQLPIVKIKHELELRMGQSDISTARREADDFEIISGYYHERTTGAPLTFIIKNVDVDQSNDANHGLIRPSHADYSAFMKYGGANDDRGGGHFSGRLTAPLVILGVLCNELLLEQGIIIASRIASIKDIVDAKLDYQQINPDVLLAWRGNPFPVQDRRALQLMQDTIKKAQKNLDSVGGTIETYCLGLKPGIGEPFFDNLESYLSHLLFAIPGIKGIEFGDGFDLTKKTGSEANDYLEYQNHKVHFMSNHAGGINGGISNGNYLKFRLAVKPTASIAKEMPSIDVITGENVIIKNTGRNDPCFVHRALVVVNALTAYGIYDLLCERRIEK